MTWNEGSWNVDPSRSTEINRLTIVRTLPATGDDQVTVIFSGTLLEGFGLLEMARLNLLQQALRQGGVL